MKYTLINKAGKVRQFFVLEVAEMYRDIEGGVIIDTEILKQREAAAV